MNSKKEQNDPSYEHVIKRINRIYTHLNRCDRMQKRIDARKERLIDELNDWYLLQSWYNGQGIY